MKGSTNFLIALAAALITFGTLTLAFGPRHVERWGHHGHGYGAHYHAPHDCDKDEGEHHNRESRPNEPGDS